MATSRGIMARKGRRNANKTFELQLTSMMDVLVIIVVFLLKSYNISTHNFSNASGLQLPLSGSQDNPTDSLQVIVTPESITVDQNRILDFQQLAGQMSSKEANYSFRSSDLDEGGRRIIPLYDALIKAKEKTELLLAKSQSRTADGKPLPFEGILAIQADKRVKYDTIKKIMYTAGSAGYKVFRFLALKKDT
jgi:biopolymer transport protein ExbD